MALSEFAGASNIQIPDWVAIPYLAGNFLSDSGTWVVESGDVGDLSYQLLGKSLVLSWTIGTSTITGTPTDLWIKLPSGLICKKSQQVGAHLINVSGAMEVGYWTTVAGEDKIRLRRLTVNFAAVTNTAGLWGCAIIEVR